MLQRIARRGSGFALGLAMLGLGWIDGASAQASAPQRSLFPEGQCGGLFCSAIGGSQAPLPPSYPPPPCGGGLLCSADPYGSGVPVTAAEIARLRAEHARQEAEARPMLPPPSPVKKHRRAARAKAKVEAADK